MAIRPGDPWGQPCFDVPDLEVRGNDAALRDAVAAHPGALIAFEPTADSDIARALGIISGRERTGIAVPMDILRLDDGRLALNTVILGTRPDRHHRLTRSHDFASPVGRATAIVVATGQFLDGLDVVPRGHPGDGRAEVHTYRLRASERRAMRSRLRLGTHVPHPRIEVLSVRSVSLHPSRPVPIDIDGRAVGQVAGITITVESAAYRLLL